MKRESEVQAKISMRKANEERQYGNNAFRRFGTCAGKIIDLFEQYVEDEMTVPPKGGRGCRVQKEHIDLCFGKFYQAMREFMDSESKNNPITTNEEVMVDSEIERLKEIINNYETVSKDALKDDASLYADMLDRINELELHLADKERKERLSERNE